ncbi:hypothetical protein CALVIDRAFT_552086 [Calocera viscosa TUFC12733]|uniref:Uncharacterized protein n=1 Tax=Calocera viscosa (strain TUFC12733) TaxID=1330018 RepID=A0A167SCI5_CALVF|nr:hypothetical protein CALVIDRAFT_552086 [Calocera viscosa TUFC12733]
MADMEDNDSEISVPISTTHRTSKPSRSILKRSRQQADRFVRAVSRPVAFRLPKRERPSEANPGEPDVVAVRRRGSQGSSSGGFLRAFLFGAPRMRRERTDDYQDEEDAEEAAAARIPDPLGMPFMPRPIVMPHPGGGISFVPPDEIPVNPPPLPLDPTPPQEGEYRRDFLQHTREGVEDLSMAHTGYGAPASGYPADLAGGGAGLEGSRMMPMPEAEALSPRSRRSFQSPRSHRSQNEYAGREQYDRELEASMPPTPPQPHRRVVHVAPDIPLSPPMSPQSRRSHRSSRSAARLPTPAPPVQLASPEQPMQQVQREPIATDYAYQPAPPAPPAQALAPPVPAVHIQPPSDGGSRYPSPSRPVSHLSQLTHRTQRSSASAAPSEAGSPTSLPLNWDRIPHAARPMSYFRPPGTYEDEGLFSQAHFISRLPPTATTTEKLAHVIENVSRYPWVQKPWQTVQFVPGTKGAFDSRYEIPETVAQGSGVASWYSDVGEEKRASMGGVRQSNYAPRRDPSVAPQVVDTYPDTAQPRGYAQPDRYEQHDGYAQPDGSTQHDDYSNGAPAPSAGLSAYRPPLERRSRHDSRPRSTISIPAPPPPPKSPRFYHPRALAPRQQATIVFREDGTPELLIPEGAEMPTSPILITDPSGRTGWFMPQVGMARSLEG